MRCKTKAESLELYNELLDAADRDLARDKDAVMKFYRENVCRGNLFWFLLFILNRADIDNDWLYERCMEVQESPDGYLDLWGREHRKSTIITYALTIQDILRNPEITIGIFSHTRGVAKGFLRQIKVEFENNRLLRELFPDILYQDPQKEAPKWSEDDGIIPVRRKTNPKEATVEAWGLVDGQPTSKHFQLMIYDDVVTLESVNTVDQMQKTTDAWRMSRNLGSENGRVRYIGTRYHFRDTYGEMLRLGAVKPRIYPATVDGTVTGAPVFFKPEYLEQRLRELGSYMFSCQMLLNPVEDDVQGFSRDWLRYYQNCNYEAMNRYIVVDPANEKKKTSDYTVFMVIGLSADNNYYLIDMIRDRYNLTERTDMLFFLHSKYMPLKVGYERYGMQADVQHIQYVQKSRNYRFDVIELGGSMPKNNRIRKLIPVFEQGRFYLPEKLYKVTQDHRKRDLIQDFINEEYLAFPVGLHDDMLDCMARILDVELGAVFPLLAKTGRRGSYYSRLAMAVEAAA